MNSITSLTPNQLRQAADIQEQIEALQQQLSMVLGGTPSVIKPALVDGAPAPKRKISAAGIARIRAAQKARWAKAKGQATLAKAGTRPRRTMSPAARARLAAIAKARWAKARKAGKSRL